MSYDLEKRCSGCDRFLKLKAVKSSEVIVTCPDRKCKQENVIKVVMMSDFYKQHNHKGQSNGK